MQGLIEKSLTVEGMTCRGCANSIEKGLKEIPFLKKVQVDLLSKKVFVAIDEKAGQENSFSLIEKKLSDLGFVVLA